MSNDRKIMVQTPHGRLYVHEDFTIEPNIPFAGLIRLTDKVTKEIFWLNMDHVVWIGPRE
jgi:hypothetical protein